MPPQFSVVAKRRCCNLASRRSFDACSSTRPCCADGKAATLVEDAFDFSRTSSKSALTSFNVMFSLSRAFIAASISSLSIACSFIQHENMARVGVHRCLHIYIFYPVWLNCCVIHDVGDCQRCINREHAVVVRCFELHGYLLLLCVEYIIHFYDRR